MTTRRSPGPDTAAAASDELPVHFFTIVLNGQPFIGYHLDVFRELGFRWHWHVVEGVAEHVRDSAWPLRLGGSIDPRTHAHGLSVDGTSEYLDELAERNPDLVSIYRKPSGGHWAGKRAMVSAPLAAIREECLLWEIDADELWTPAQISAARELFLADPERTAAYYWCHPFVAPDAVIATRYNYAADPSIDVLRTWRYRPGDRWEAHAPPILNRGKGRRRRDLGLERPLLQAETEAVGAVFQHFTYVTEEQVRFKETYYGYRGAVDAWRALQKALREERGPLRLGDYLPWVKDETLVDTAERRHVSPLATQGPDGRWAFARGPSAGASLPPTRRDVVVVDGVAFQEASDSESRRLWNLYLGEWVQSGFAERVLFIDRGGAGPRLPGLPTRSLPAWSSAEAALDSLRLQRVCDEEGAAVFVSTGDTRPLATPSIPVSLADGAAALASALSAAADRPPAATDAAWVERRKADAAEELAARSSRSPGSGVKAGGRRYPSRLEVLALRHLPGWAIETLRFSRAVVHQLAARGRG
jgi:hypothetical protein